MYRNLKTFGQLNFRIIEYQDLHLFFPGVLCPDIHDSAGGQSFFRLLNRESTLRASSQQERAADVVWLLHGAYSRPIIIINAPTSRSS